MGVGEDSGVSLNHDQAVAALVPASYFLLLSFFYYFRYVIPLPWLQPYFSQPFTSRLSCLICSAPDGDTTVLGGRAVGELLRAAPRGVGGVLPTHGLASDKLIPAVVLAIHYIQVAWKLYAVALACVCLW